MISRRQFLNTLVPAATAPLLLHTTAWSNWLTPAHSLVDNIGLQLYTVRDALAAHPQQTIETIQQAGYKQVELFDTQLLAQLQPIFKNLGIAIHSSHFASPLLTGNWEPLVSMGGQRPPESYTLEKVVDEAAQYELRYLVFPFIFPQNRGGLDFYKGLAEKLNRAGETCQKAGIQLCYHNHSFEFQPMENTSPFQVLRNETDADLLHFEIDVFWVSVAGLDPASFIQDHGERVRLLHLKDKKQDTIQSYDTTLPPDAFQPVGSGSLDFMAILSAAEAVGVTHCFVEQDQSEDALASIRQSAQYLRTLAR